MRNLSTHPIVVIVVALYLQIGIAIAFGIEWREVAQIGIELTTEETV